jgi:endogenous inhibitor of DNA gyrase (YacG/DUF329 family)
MVRPMTCPICRKPVPPPAEGVTSAVPFCSDRCRQIDFFRWNDGRYAIVEQLDPEQIAESLNKADPELADE